MTHAFITFSTALGECALAWEGDAVVRFSLPAGEGGQRPFKPRAWHGAAPWEGELPAWVAQAVADVQALMQGELRTLREVPVNLGQMSDFNHRVYDITRAIDPGDTLTYGEVAARLGEPGAARAVGRALGENPIPVIIPCHRVLGAGGALVGFSAPGGVQTKRRLLAIEAPLLRREGMLF